MATNQDSSISLLDPAGSLTGAELFVIVQGGDTLRDNLNNIKAFILASVNPGTGDVVAAGNFTPGYYPVASGAKTLTNGRIHQNSTDLYLRSPDTDSYVIVQDNLISVRAINGASLGTVTAQPTSVQLAWTDGTVDSSISLQDTTLALNHDYQLSLNAPDIYIPGLTANTVLILDGSKNLRSSAITPTKLGYLTDVTSNIGAAINGKMTNVMTAVGDIIIGSTAGAPARLGAGTNGHVLTLVGGSPAWTAPSGGAGTVTSIIAGTGLTGGTITTSGTIALATTAVTPGSYTNANLTVDAYGRITAASNGSGGGSTYTAAAGGGLTLNSTAFSIGDTTNLFYSSGKIGLGTGSPNSKLHIETSTIRGIYINADDTAGPNAFEINVAGAVDGLQINTDSGVAVNILAVSGKGVVYEGDGTGVTVNSNGDVAGIFRSNTTALQVSQTGELIANSTDDCFVIAREVTLAGYTHTGSLLKIVDYTSGSPVNKFLVKDTGALQINDGSQIVGGVVTCINTDGTTTFRMPSGYPMPGMTYDATTAGTPSKTIIAGSIPGNTLINTNDTVVFDYILGNTGGTAGLNAIYGFRIGGNTEISDLTIPLDVTSNPISVRLIIRRTSTTAIYIGVIWNFSTHAPTARTVYSGAGAGTYDFTSAISVNVVANEGVTNRHISGNNGYGYYQKAI